MACLTIILRPGWSNILVEELQFSHASYPPSVLTAGCDEARIAHTDICLASWVFQTEEKNDNRLLTTGPGYSLTKLPSTNLVQYMRHWDMTQPISEETSRTFLPCINKRIWDRPYHEWVIPPNPNSMLVIDCLKEFDREANEFIFSVSSSLPFPRHDIFKVQSSAEAFILRNVSHSFKISGFPLDWIVCFYFLLFLWSDLISLLQNCHPRWGRARDDTNLLSLMAAGQAVPVPVVCLSWRFLASKTQRLETDTAHCSVTPHCLPAALAGWKLGKFSLCLTSLPG